MKKTLISLNILILFFICTVNSSYGAEDFFLNGKFSEVQPKTANMETTKQEEGFFSKLKNNTKEKFKSKKEKNKEQQKGYYGTLPDINREFKYKKQTPATPKKSDYKIPSLEELEQENFKPAPFDDTLFLDNIIKQEQTSDYINKLQKVKKAYSSLKNALEEETNIQKINAAINMVDLYSNSVQKSYENKSEALKESYKEIIAVNYHAKIFGNLLYDSNYYARIVPTEQGQYSPQNIEKKKQELLIKVNRVLFLIDQES